MLQTLLDKLHSYCLKWNIEVNIDKTKIVVFQNGWRRCNCDCKYGNVVIEQVDSYVYLGVLLHRNGKFNHTQKKLADQGSKALYNLLSVIRNNFLPAEQKCDLFDSMVVPVLLYGSEIWGFHKATEVEYVQNKFFRYILNVNKSAPNDVLYGELGRFPLCIKRKERILKYWVKLLENPHSIMYNVYLLLVSDANSGKVNWASNIRDILINLGFPHYWYCHDVSCINIALLQQRLYDQFIQQWYNSIESSSKLVLYKQFKQYFQYECYLDLNINQKFVNMLAKFRCGNLKLNIETGRYTSVPRHCRLCTVCNMKMVEDEFHFLLVCPAYRHLRLRLLPKYFNSWPSLYKFNTLLSSNSKCLLSKLSKYIHAAWNHRTELLTN